jgi:hypothetical protein
LRLASKAPLKSDDAPIPAFRTDRRPVFPTGAPEEAMFNVFTQHPHSVGQTYQAHLRSACSFGSLMLLAGLGCFLHGLFPFLFTSTGSRAVTYLHEKMIVERGRT